MVAMMNLTKKNENDCNSYAEVQHVNSNNNMEHFSKLIRYSRSSLYFMKNNKLSVRKPDCLYKSELNGLGLWKMTTSKTVRNQTSKSRYFAQSLKHVEDTSKTTFNSVSKKKNEQSFEARSISSAHLLPAFAKRRLISSSENNGSNERLNTNDMTDTDDSRLKQELIKDRLNYDTRKNDLENLQNGETDEVNMQDIKNIDYDNEIALSPTNSAFKSGYINSNDRRIGSGRFIPRDFEWNNEEYEFIRDKNSSSKQSLTTNNKLNNKYPIDSLSNDFKEKLRKNNHIDENLNKKNNESRYKSFSTKSKEIGENRNILSKLDSKESIKPLQYIYHKYEEPEWFSEGPTSKLDTIELRGFDDVEENFVEKEEFECCNESTVSETIPEESAETEINSEKAVLVETNKAHLETNEGNFNLENILCLDSLTMNVDSKFPYDSSRFSQWFSQENSSIGEPKLNDKKNAKIHARENENKTLMDFLKSGNISELVPNNKFVNVNSIPSVEELESRMRKLNSQSESDSSNREQSPSMDVFNRFLNQLSEHAIQSSKKKIIPHMNSIAPLEQVSNVGNINCFQMSLEMDRKVNNINNSPTSALNMVHDDIADKLKEGPRYIINSYVHQSNPSPLSFTPTSVLRKMTAERDIKEPKMALNNINQDYFIHKLNTEVETPNTPNIYSYKESSHVMPIVVPRMILGGGNIVPIADGSSIQKGRFSCTEPQLAIFHASQHDSQTKWNNICAPPNTNHSTMTKSDKALGRPILKGDAIVHQQFHIQPHIDSSTYGVEPNNRSQQSINSQIILPHQHAPPFNREDYHNNFFTDDAVNHSAQRTINSMPQKSFLGSRQNNEGVTMNFGANDLIQVNSPVNYIQSHINSNWARPQTVPDEIVPSATSITLESFESYMKRNAIPRQILNH